MPRATRRAIGRPSSFPTARPSSSRSRPTTSRATTTRASRSFLFGRASIRRSSRAERARATSPVASSTSAPAPCVGAVRREGAQAHGRGDARPRGSREPPEHGERGFRRLAQVYVKAYPALGGRTLVSTEGGSVPTWSRNGRELFYLEGDRMMAVAVTSEDPFAATKPRFLFEAKTLPASEGY